MEKAEEARTFIHTTMKRAGFVISVEKSDGPRETSQNKKYLGMIISS